MDPLTEKIILIGVGAGVGGPLTLVGKIVFDWLKNGRGQAQGMTQEDCDRRQETCRASVQRDFDRGSDHFSELDNSNKAIKGALMVILLALIPICRAVAGDKADCDALERAAERLTE